MKYFLPILLSIFWAVSAMGAVKTETVEYKQGDTSLEGYLSYDDALKGPRPGIVVFHDWMGNGPFSKGRAEELAKLGYVAFAADIYGKGVRPKNAQEAGAQAGLYKNDRPVTRARANAALAVLRKNPRVSSKRLAAIGYCFGGMVALELARSGADIIGAVTFHGALDTPTPGDAKNIKGNVLALHGADDPFVTLQNVEAFEDEMRKAGVDWQLIAYGGAVHAFSNPAAGNDNSKGAAYNEKADRRSWAAMNSFFAEIFK
ncbi:MAG: dienelactone hydrolase family protein [bacterium]